MTFHGPKAPKMKTSDYRDRMRAAGLRPVEIWVPDVRANGFKAKLFRQVAKLDPRHEAETMDFIEAATESSASL